MFDEIEKGHQDIYNILLQVFDEGILTDAMGRKVDFKNTILIMTSNIGTRNLKENGIGFFEENRVADQNKVESTIFKSVKNIFSPELLNRLDEIIVFNSLSERDIFKIIELQLKDLYHNLSELGINLRVYKTAKNLILEKGYNIDYGVRFLRRAIQNMIEDPISKILLKNNLKGETLIVKAVKGKIKISTKSDFGLTE